jgi:hypothetical protein
MRKNRSQQPQINTGGIYREKQDCTVGEGFSSRKVQRRKSAEPIGE